MMQSYLTPLHHFLASWWGLGLCTAVGLAGPPLSWLISFSVVGGNPRVGRASLAVSISLVGTLILAFLVRAVAWSVTGLHAGPLQWLDAIGAPQGGWLPADVVAVGAVVHGLAFVGGAPFSAWWVRRSSRVVAMTQAPGLVAASAVAMLGVGVAVGVPLVMGSYLDLSGLDLLAAMPTLLMAGALAVFARSDPPALDVVEEDGSVPYPDIVRAWRAAGALGATDGAWQTRVPSAASVGDSVANAAWRIAGGRGPSPGALDALTTPQTAQRRVLLVGDLPDPTEQTFLTASLVLAVGEQGRRVLVVGADAKVARDHLLAALRRAGLPLLGPMPAGAAELAQALAGRRRPVAVFVSEDELGRDVIGLLGDKAQVPARAWASTVSRIILARVDRGSALGVTHRAFTLRRLDLVLRSIGSRPDILATGLGGRGTLRLVQRCFFETEEFLLRLEPRSHAGVSIWLAHHDFLKQTDQSWPVRAAAPVVDNGHRVRISDPVGTFGNDDTRVAGADVAVVHDLTFEGVASVAAMDELWLVAGWRALSNRLPTIHDADHHHALWGLLDTPNSRFLRTRLDELSQAGKLDAPSPVVAFDNVQVAWTHLQAAIRESEQDESALVAWFGPALVDRLRAEGLGVAREAVYLDGVGHAVRSKVFTQQPGRATVPPVTALTDQRLLVVERYTGLQLGEVDAATASTRFHPNRVFAWGGRRYSVPLDSLDLAHRRLMVEPALSERRLSLPDLTAALTLSRIVDNPQRVHRPPLRVWVATVDVDVTERVRGTWQDEQQRIEYPPVTSNYPTRCRAILFEKEGTALGFAHLRHLFHHVVRSQLLIAPDDIHVEHVPRNWITGFPGGLVVVDRHVRGAGVAHALHVDTVMTCLERIRALLAGCECRSGCSRCAPSVARADGAMDRLGALDILLKS